AGRRGACGGSAPPRCRALDVLGGASQQRPRACASGGGRRGKRAGKRDPRLVSRFFPAPATLTAMARGRLNTLVLAAVMLAVVWHLHAGMNAARDSTSATIALEVYSMSTTGPRDRVDSGCSTAHP